MIGHLARMQTLPFTSKAMVKNVFSFHPELLSCHIEDAVAVDKTLESHCAVSPSTKECKRYAVKAAYENTWAWRKGICVGLESNPGRSGIRSGNPEFSTVCLCLPLCLVSVIWTCAWIDAVPSEVAMSPTWLTRIASLLLAFHLHYVRSAMCPRQMATSRFLPLWKAPRKDPLRNVSINGIDLFHKETIAISGGPILPHESQ